MKSYVIVISSELGTRDELQDFLDSIYEVTYWYACLPNCIFYTSSITMTDLTEKIRVRFGDKRFFITECIYDSNGWLPKEAWHLIQHPDNPILK
jgi:hypothetical protein